MWMCCYGIIWLRARVTGTCHHDISLLSARWQTHVAYVLKVLRREIRLSGPIGWGSCAISTSKWGWKVPSVNHARKSASSSEDTFSKHSNLSLSTLCVLQKSEYCGNAKNNTSNTSSLVTVIAKSLRQTGEIAWSLLNKSSRFSSWYSIKNDKYAPQKMAKQHT